MEQKNKPEYVIKRDGRKVPFDKNKIKNAVNAAIFEVKGTKDDITADYIADFVTYQLANLENKIPEIELIQNEVEDALMMKDKEIARAYIRYRYKKELVRDTDKTYESILKLVNLENQELKDENSNKNAVVASTQRDYMAGEISKALSEKYLLPFDVVDAHNKGIIHFHDEDYFAQRIMNCCLVNLEDMLQNGTVINKTMIERPHSFATACNIATQVMAIVASGQYGGQSISLTHLAPFVNVSRQKIRQEVEEEIPDISDAAKEDIVRIRLGREIKRGVQTIQYQINTLNTSNGQIGRPIW